MTELFGASGKTRVWRQDVPQLLTPVAALTPSSINSALELCSQPVTLPMPNYQFPHVFIDAIPEVTMLGNPTQPLSLRFPREIVDLVIADLAREQKSLVIRIPSALVESALRISDADRSLSPHMIQKLVKVPLPPTALTIFERTLRNSNPTFATYLNLNDRIKLLQEEWNLIADQEKSRFVAEATAAQTLFEQSHPNFRDILLAHKLHSESQVEENSSFEQSLEVSTSEASFGATSSKKAHRRRKKMGPLAKAWTEKKKRGKKRKLDDSFEDEMDLDDRSDRSVGQLHDRDNILIPIIPIFGNDIQGPSAPTAETRNYLHAFNLSLNSLAVIERKS
jgi:hypothetical protein